MLREIKKVRQNPGEDKRRWFTDEYWDLYIWENLKKEITGVQLAYGKPFGETAFTWIKGRGSANQQVDDLKAGYMKNTGAAILTRKRAFNKEYVINRFLKDSPELDPGIVNFVCNVLKNS